ncbi:MAG: serralysin [Candidatus Bathyarchaeota archaeon B24]|nr:MAG: serralysin [Candidatus Bathyarchaeota archaeon B24]RLI25662.1 MAG: polyprenyl synthetase family protein [Candidatus Bathyarchaeota archaeon]
MKELMDEISKVSRRVSEEISAIMEGLKVPEVLYESSYHLLKAGGKRLRPFMLVKSYEACGGEGEKPYPAAAGVEILHTFTLIHDDIIDRDETRRGVPTVHVLWGIPQAIISGDMLFALVFRTLSKGLRDVGVEDSVIVEVVGRFSKTLIDICAGQTMDMVMAEKPTTAVTVDEYMEMIKLKTAVLYMASAEIGGLLAGASSEELEALRSYGLNSGLAFQMIDDVLGVSGVEEELGKPVGSDIREGKKTIVVLEALSRLDDAGKRRLLGVLGDRGASRDRIMEAIRLIESSGAVEEAKRLARLYSSKAREALRRLPATDARRLLEALTDFIVERRF